MHPDDYTERLISIHGKNVKVKVVKSTTGVEYGIGPYFNQGGVASVFRAIRLSDNKKCVFKEYKYKPELAQTHRLIRRNIERLMQSPITGEDAVTPLDSFVGPMDQDSLIRLPASNSFGYVMELVDTKRFTPIMKLRKKDLYPEADVVCRMMENLAFLFRRMHLGSGWCYKDINEENIFVDRLTGDVRIIDCDNISIARTRTIIGTPFYMAPEIYDDGMPDTFSDYFELATLFYRFLVGGYPLDGPKTVKYLMDHNTSCLDPKASRVIYGDKMALFSFDPHDSSNCIRGKKESSDSDIWEIQCLFWDRLPEEIQNLFIKTFSTGLKIQNRTKRAADFEWKRVCADLRKNKLVTCRHCKKKNFGIPKTGKKCIYCGRALPKLAAPAPQPSTHGTTTVITTPSAQRELTTVTFDVMRDVAPAKISVKAKRKSLLPGTKIHPQLKNDGWMKIQYNPKLNCLAAVNLSPFVWTITSNGRKNTCGPNERVILTPGVVITVLHRQLQMTVQSVN